MIKFDFEAAWNRVCEATPIKKLGELAKALDLSQPAVSRQKGRGTFPPDWAIAIELQYGISTRWILTGQGPERRGNLYDETGTANNLKVKEDRLPEFLYEFGIWAREMDPRSFEWLENQLEALFPGFRAWREQKKSWSGAEAPLHEDQVGRKVA